MTSMQSRPRTSQRTDQQSISVQKGPHSSFYARRKETSSRKVPLRSKQGDQLFLPR